jgi:serine/threonine-protein kinase
VKVLKPELAAVLGAERFVQEITTTAALQHPHILPLFDSGEADGFLYYVMPFIDGETLRAKLDREDAARRRRAVKITATSPTRSTSAHARRRPPRHQAREHPPARRAPDGRRLRHRARGECRGGWPHDGNGPALGTPHYMSPEQATAEKEITRASDMYSLGQRAVRDAHGHPPHTAVGAADHHEDHS